MSDNGFVYLASDLFVNEDEFMNEIHKSSHVKQFQRNAPNTTFLELEIGKWYNFGTAFEKLD
ncbi:hypothetical protein [Desulfosporosinus fructosivorans]